MPAWSLSQPGFDKNTSTTSTPAVSTEPTAETLSKGSGERGAAISAQKELRKEANALHSSSTEPAAALSSSPEKYPSQGTAGPKLTNAELKQITNSLVESTAGWFGTDREKLLTAIHSVTTPEQGKNLTAYFKRSQGVELETFLNKHLSRADELSALNQVMGFDKDRIAGQLLGAMKGLGSDPTTVKRIVSELTTEQAKEVRAAFFEKSQNIDLLEYARTQHAFTAVDHNEIRTKFEGVQPEYVAGAVHRMVRNSFSKEDPVKVKELIDQVREQLGPEGLSEFHSCYRTLTGGVDAHLDIHNNIDWTVQDDSKYVDIVVALHPQEERYIRPAGKLYLEVFGPGYASTETAKSAITEAGSSPHDRQQFERTFNKYFAHPWKWGHEGTDLRKDVLSHEFSVTTRQELFNALNDGRELLAEADPAKTYLRDSEFAERRTETAIVKSQVESPEAEAEDSAALDEAGYSLVSTTIVPDGVRASKTKVSTEEEKSSGKAKEAKPEAEVKPDAKAKVKSKVETEAEAAAGLAAEAAPAKPESPKAEAEPEKTEGAAAPEAAAPAAEPEPEAPPITEKHREIALQSVRDWGLEPELADAIALELAAAEAAVTPRHRELALEQLQKEEKFDLKEFLTRPLTAAQTLSFKERVDLRALKISDAERENAAATAGSIPVAPSASTSPARTVSATPAPAVTASSTPQPVAGVELRTVASSAPITSSRIDFGTVRFNPEVITDVPNLTNEQMEPRARLSRIGALYKEIAQGDTSKVEELRRVLDVDEEQRQAMFDITEPWGKGGLTDAQRGIKFDIQALLIMGGEELDLDRLVFSGLSEEQYNRQFQPETAEAPVGMEVRNSAPSALNEEDSLKLAV